jgi:sulfonate transport system substrate-binding protein
MRVWKFALTGLLAAVVCGAGGAQAQQPVKIRASWVAPVANWASILLEKKDLARHLGSTRSSRRALPVRRR